MQNEIEKVLNFREYLIYIDCQLDFQPGTLLYGFLPETSQSLKIHHIKNKEVDKSQVVLNHRSFSNHISVNLICLSFAKVIFTHLTGFDGVQHIFGKAQ